MGSRDIGIRKISFRKIGLSLFRMQHIFEYYAVQAAIIQVRVEV